MERKNSGGGHRNQSDNSHEKASHDNRSQQLNPESDKYYQSRGEEGRPDDWRERLEQ